MITPLGPKQVDELLRAAQAGDLVHLVGVGGCGMSGLGHLLLDLGFRVSGSDLTVNEETRQLQGRGAMIRVGHAPENVATGAALVAYTSAARPDNPELAKAAVLGIPSVRRATLLAALLRRQQGICVAGMHGKTTSAALLAFALNRLGAHSSFAIGALVPQLIPHARFSQARDVTPTDKAPYFVIEADESDGTLRQFEPEHAIVLNVDADHLDYFGSIDAVVAEFGEFIRQTRQRVIFCADDPRLAEMCARNSQAISYGFHPLATYRAEAQSEPT